MLAAYICFILTVVRFAVVDICFRVIDPFCFMRCFVRQINAGEDLPREFLVEVYNSIKEHEIQVPYEKTSPTARGMGDTLPLHPLFHREAFHCRFSRGRLFGIPLLLTLCSWVGIIFWRLLECCAFLLTM